MLGCGHNVLWDRIFSMVVVELDLVRVVLLTVNIEVDFPLLGTYVVIPSFVCLHHRARLASFVSVVVLSDLHSIPFLVLCCDQPFNRLWWHGIYLAGWVLLRGHRYGGA